MRCSVGAVFNLAFLGETGTDNEREGLMGWSGMETTEEESMDPLGFEGIPAETKIDNFPSC